MPSGTAARSTESGPPLAALGGPASKATLPIDNVPRLALMIVILINARGYVGNQPPEEALSKVPLGFKQWMRRARTMSTDASSPVPASFGAPMRRPTGTSGVGGSRPLKNGVVELPAGRPLLPKDAAQFATMLRQALTSSLQLKQMLIREHLLQSRCEGVSKARDVDDVVAGIRKEARHAFRPERRGDAGRKAAPIVAGQNGALNAESVEEIDQVSAKRSLLSAAHRGFGQKARGAERPPTKASRRESRRPC
jgi:hypothetical protein